MNSVKWPIAKVFARAFAITLSALTFGCSSVVALLNGANSMAPRKAKDLNSGFRVTLVYANTPPIRRELWLQLYYDTQSSARGNVWSVRLAGQPDLHGEIPINVQDPQLGRVTFSLGMDSLRKLVEKRNMALSPISINGIEHRHIRSEEGHHIYQSSEDGSTVSVPYLLVVEYL